MAIRFLERFLKKHNTKANESSVFSLGQAEEILKNNKDISQKALEKEARPHINEILAYIQEISEKAEEIGEKDIPEELSDRIVKIMTASKPVFVESVADSFKEVVNGPDGGLEDYARKLEEALSALLKTMTSHGRYLPIAYGEEFEEIRRASKAIYEKKKGIEKILEGKKESSFEEITRKIRENLSASSVLSDESDAASRMLALLDAEIKRLESEYDAIDESEESSRLAERKKERDDVKKQMEYLENVVYNALNPLKRPLRIYRKDPRTKDLPQARDLVDLEKYAENPKDALHEGRNLTALLKNMQALVEKGLIESREQETIKTLSKVLAAKTLDVPALGREYATLQSRQEKTEKSIASSRILAEKTGLEKSIEQKKRERREKHQELEKVARKITEIKRDTSEAKDALEKELSLATGKKTTIILETAT